MLHDPCIPHSGSSKLYSLQLNLSSWKQPPPSIVKVDLQSLQLGGCTLPATGLPGAQP